MVSMDGNNSILTNRIAAHEEQPPSTFAAQIVNNLTDTRRHLNPDSNRAHLRQLLHEILAADRNGDHLAGAIETSIEVNYRLIYVVARAGLEELSSPSPFVDQADRHDQIRDSLAVIELTIRRSSDSLFYSSQNSDLIVHPGGFLFLWLVPHLINLLRSDINEELRASATSVLREALATQTTPISLKIRFNPLLKYVQGCINGTEILRKQ